MTMLLFESFRRSLFVRLCGLSLETSSGQIESPASSAQRGIVLRPSTHRAVETRAAPSARSPRSGHLDHASPDSALRRPAQDRLAVARAATVASTYVVPAPTIIHISRHIYDHGTPARRIRRRPRHLTVLHTDTRRVHTQTTRTDNTTSRGHTPHDTMTVSG